MLRLVREIRNEEVKSQLRFHRRNPIRRSGPVVFLEFEKETFVGQPTVSQELCSHAVVERRDQVSAQVTFHFRLGAQTSGNLHRNFLEKFSGACPVREYSNGKEPRLPAMKLCQGNTALVRFHMNDIEDFIQNQCELARRRTVLQERW